jgi:hypothetical protein
MPGCRSNVGGEASTATCRPVLASTSVRHLVCAVLVWSGLLAAAACGPPRREGGAPASSSDEAEIDCPAPIGAIRGESCAGVVDDFGALSVSGALKQAGTDSAGALRAEAIRAAAALGSKLKEKRVALCDAYNACKVTPAEHTAKDKALADLMTSLLALWDARQFADPKDVVRFHGAVRTLSKRLDGAAPASSSAAGAAALAGASAAETLPGDKLARLSQQGVSFSSEAGAVTVRAHAGELRQVLRSSPSLRLRGGRRYLVKVLGSYVPATPPLISSGDEVVARVRYRAEQAGELYAALRSLDDTDASEGTVAWKIAAGEKGAHEATLSARPGESGFYLAVGARSPGPVWLDDVELVRGGRVLAAARAEEGASTSGAEPPHTVKASCKPDAAQPLAGKRSLRCAAGDGDLVTIAAPGAFLELSIRSASGARAVLRTQSLEGGRSLDATLSSEDADLVLAMSGEGAATIRAIEVRALSQ